MKTSTVGLVLAAILMVLAGVGFGIAQAAVTPSEQPVLSFEDQEAFEQSDSSSPFVSALPSAIDLDYGADSISPSDVAQARGPIETGAIPSMVVEESWMNDYGND